MYKKYINKKGKKVGPYYYDSIRLKDGKIKTVYLGSDEAKARNKIALLKKGISVSVKKRSSATLHKVLQTEKNLLQLRPRRHKVQHVRMHYGDAAVLVGIVLLLSLSYFHYGSPFVEDFGYGEKLKATPFMNYLEDSTSGGTESEANKITGQVIFSDEVVATSHSYDLHALANTSQEYTLHLEGIEKLSTLKLTGRILTFDAGEVKVFLTHANSGETYLILDSNDLKSNDAFFKGISGFAVGEISPLASQEASLAEKSAYDELYTLGLLQGFSVINSKGESLKYKANKQNGITVIKFDDIENAVTEIDIDEQAENGWMAYEEYLPRGFLEPVNVSFKRVFGFDVGTENRTNHTFRARSEGEMLYQCDFWDFELGICLSDWHYAFDINGTTEFTASITSEVMAFAEGIFDPNKIIEPAIEEEIVEEVNETNVTLVTDPLVELVKGMNVTHYDLGAYFEECQNTCFMKGILNGDFIIKIYLDNALFEIDNINLSVIENGTYTMNIFDENGNSLFNALKPISEPVRSTTDIVLQGGVEGNYTEETVNYGVVINRPVTWKKTITSNASLSNVEIDIPAGAKNITVLKNVNDQKELVESATLIIEEGIYEKLNQKPVVADTKSLGGFFGNIITGNVVALLGLSNETNQTDSTITVNQSVVPSNTSSDNMTIIIGDNVAEIEIEYQTPGPTSYEEETEHGKKITVSSDIHYTNILSYTDIPELPSSSISLYRLVNGSEVPWGFTPYDHDGSGLIDYIEWIVPSLSNDTYLLIIDIVNAVHLDANYAVISNIYNETKAQDDVWSEKIYHNEYVRVTFKENLTFDKDITVYARGSRFDQSYIEVHYFNSSEIITTFPIIAKEDLYKVLLTNMNGSYDTFDLRVRNIDDDPGAYLEFDYIVDPQAQPGGKKLLTLQQCDASFNSTVKNNYTVVCNGTYPSACGNGQADRLSCDDTFVENITYARNRFTGVRVNVTNTTITNCNTIGEVFLCFEQWVNSTSGLAQCLVAVDANGGGSYNNLTTTCPGATANPGLTCLNATGNETWSCSTFFGVNPVGALARTELATTTSNNFMFSIDALFFNVTYVETNQIPNLTLLSPVNDTSFDVETKSVNLSVNVTDDLVPENNVTIIIYGNRTGPPGVDDLLYKSNVTNATNIQYTWRGYPFDVESKMLFGYHFDNNADKGENATNILDWSGHFNGSVNSTPFINYSNSIFGGHMEFKNGDKDYIKVDDCDFECYRYSNKTYLAWVRPTAGAGSKVIFAGWSTAGSGAGLVIYKFHNNFVLGLDASVANSFNLTGFFDNNTWQHLAVVMLENKTFYVYKNGILNGTFSTTVSISDVSSVENFKVGAFTDAGTNSWLGGMDEVAVINRSLSATEIANLVNLTTGKHYWYVYGNDSTNGTTTATREFSIGGNTPTITLNAPANNTNFTEVGSIVLNATIVDPEGNNLTVRIYGGNSTTGSVVGTQDLLYFSSNVSNGSQVTYNWTSQVLDPEGNYSLLVHLDNNRDFSENATNVFDFASLSNPQENGTIKNDGAIIDVSSGKFGGAYNSSSTGDLDGHIDFGDVDDWIGEQNITYMAWLRPIDTSGTEGVIAKFAPNIILGNGKGLKIQKNQGHLQILDDGSSLFLNASNFFVANEWTHLAIVVVANKSTYVYRNGQFNKSGVYTNITDNNNVLIIGNLPTTTGGQFNSPFEGMIDEVAIINRTLNATEINNTYRLTSGVYHWFVNVTDITNVTNVSQTRTLRVDRPGQVINISIAPDDVANITNTTALLNCSFTAEDDLDATATANVNFLKEGATNVTFTLSGITINPSTINSQLLPAYYTSHFDNWSCNVSITDSQPGAGPVKVTGNTTIENFVPLFPTKKSLVNNSNTVDRTPEFVWQPDNTYGQLPPTGASCSGFFCAGNTSDPDSDNVIYYLNVTCKISAGGSCNDNYHVQVMENQSNCDSNANGRFDNADNCTYSLLTELKYFNDDGYNYEWFVEAGDNYSNATTKYGKSLTGVNLLKIDVDVGITLLNSTIMFGSMVIDEKNNTQACVLGSAGPGACPLWFKNTGNVKVDVNLTGPTTGLWSTASASDNNYFSFKIGNGSQSGQVSYVEAQTTLSYIALPARGINITIIKNFSHTDTNDEVRVDVNITVPSVEPLGNKTVIIPFVVWYLGSG